MCKGRFCSYTTRAERQRSALRSPRLRWGDRFFASEKIRSAQHGTAFLDFNPYYQPNAQPKTAPPDCRRIYPPRRYKTVTPRFYFLIAPHQTKAENPARRPSDPIIRCSASYSPPIFPPPPLAPSLKPCRHQTKAENPAARPKTENNACSSVYPSLRPPISPSSFPAVRRTQLSAAPPHILLRFSRRPKKK